MWVVMSKTAVGKRPEHVLKTRRFGGFRALSRPLPQRRRRRPETTTTTESRNGRVIIEWTGPDTPVGTLHREAA